MRIAQPQPGEGERLPRPQLLRKVALKKQEINTGSLGPLATRVDLTPWLARLEPILKDIGIPHKQWADAAILFVEDHDLNIALRRLKNGQPTEKGDATWPWHEFEGALAVLLGTCFLSTVYLARSNLHIRCQRRVDLSVSIWFLN